MIFSWPVAVLLCLVLMGCHRAAPVPLPHDAYVWQRAWTPAVTDALRESGGAIHAWRVLAAQTDAAGRLRRFAPDRAALAASGKPVVLVVRIDGQLQAWDEQALLADTLALWRDWQDGGVPLAGLEIDHDCGTARLPAYADFLARLRAALPAQARLSITALPAWLRSPVLGRVLAAVDASVLQVHAVRDPRAGLFDPALARQWAADYAMRSDKPFLLALPNYGSRVSWDAEGRLASVASEAAVLDAREDARELLAQPRQLAAFLRALQADPPPHLQGIAWFRLPTAQDLRAWSLPTWLAVIRGEPLRAQVDASLRRGDAAGGYDVQLYNAGRVDAALPARVGLPAGCSLADGVNGYRLRMDGRTPALERAQPGLLRAGHRRTIGWARCGAADEGAWHVEP
ncbi:DUF3142 domain-containing protein [Frateuria sp. Soil773]|uniref:DUF3142 domain-containing protein n=1 Tax=Frateuria sp. Soil773 TaxID=1736407 RepID=UPI000ACAAF62|nr:DUF3142 domain-containing protein [Frateuria sp. Soil773]